RSVGALAISKRSSFAVRTEATATRVPSSWHLAARTRSGTKEYPLRTGRTVVSRTAVDAGLGADVDVSSADPHDSSVGARLVALYALERDLIAIDLGSELGTRLEGARLAAGEPFVVRNGDVLTLGGLDLAAVCEPDRNANANLGAVPPATTWKGAR